MRTARSGAAVETTALMLAVAAGFLAAQADEVVLLPLKDNTLIEDPAGSLSNGAGPAFFTGRTSQAVGSIRRGVIAFDLGAGLPAGSIITRVALTLNMSDSNAGAVSVALHRLLADWGEGTSWAAGGRGAPATAGDATWIHRFHDTDLWTVPGGDFEPLPSAALEVDQVGLYTWGPTAAMTADAQGWLDHPEGAFGWILIGDETSATSVKRFDSREADPVVSVPPVLTVEYEPPCVDPDPRGDGYWRRQCLGVPADRGGLDPGGGLGPAGTTEPGFEEVVVPCADRLLADLGIPATTCEGLDPRPRHEGCEEALRKLTALVLNVCSGRLRTTCLPHGGAVGCSSATVGGAIEEIAALILQGECGPAVRCAAAAGAIRPLHGAP